MSVEGIKLKLEGSGLHGKNTKVWIDDVEVSAKVQTVDAHWGASDVNYATIRFLVGALEIDGEALPTLVAQDKFGRPVEVGGYERRRRPFDPPTGPVKPPVFPASFPPPGLTSDDVVDQ